MNKSVIRAIYNGERGNSELFKMTDKEHKLISVVCDTYDELLNALAPDQKKLHEKFLDAREKAFCEELETQYVEGFKLGLLIGIECMEE